MPEAVAVPAPSMAENRARFRESKMQSLGQERAEREAEQTQQQAPPEPAADLQEIPAPGTESEQDEFQDDPQEFADDPNQGALADDPEDQQELTPEGDSPDTDGQDVDWEKRYKDLQSAHTKELEHREELDREHGQAMAQHMQVRFELEDTLSEAKQRAEYLANVMSGNAQQYRSINWAQVPPDKVAELQSQAQQAFTLEQQAQQQFAQVQQEAEQALNTVKRREAEIARTRLRRTIPNWSEETYATLRQFAVESGWPVEVFNDVSDAFTMECIHANYTLQQGRKNVRLKPTNKTATPRGRAARRQPRDSRGKFARAELVPNQPGSYANKRRHQLAMEDGR